MFGMDDGTLTTIDQDLHRVRHSTLNPFFSKGNVRKLEPIILKRPQRFYPRWEILKILGNSSTFSACSAPSQAMPFWSMLWDNRAIVLSGSI